MKKTVKVVIEKEIEIDLPDYFLTPEYIKEYGSYIGFDDFMEEGGEVDEIFKRVAYCVFDSSDTVIDGLGQAGSPYMKKYDKNPAEFISVGCAYEAAEMEII